MWRDVKSRSGGVMWNMVRCEMCCDGECRCGVEYVGCRIWWSEARCVATLNVCEMWRGTCSNVMWNVQWWCAVAGMVRVMWNAPLKGGVM